MNDNNNKKPVWIIENYSNGNDIAELIEAVKANGYPLKLIYEKNCFEYKHIQYDNECVVFYGSIQMAYLIKNHLPTCYPIIWGNMDDFKCTNYWQHYQEYLFNDKHEFIKVSDLKQNYFDIYRKYGKEGLIFLRPDDGDKTFAGQLLDIQDFDRFWKNNIICNAKDDDIVIVSTPKKINGEYRFVVRTDTNQIIAKSCYQYQGQRTLIPSAPVGATALVEKLLALNKFPVKVFTIDIAEDSDGNYWLMEFNSFNSAGLYECNKNEIVKQISEISLLSI